ncbi:hypothetical protein K2Q16_02715 [Patescibacteria group bacterium]|nr:hypothetical protein [Patescibacteria group bacterium]
MINVSNRQLVRTVTFATVVLFFSLWSIVAEAATLRLTPGTGVYTTGSSFTVTVMVDSAGKPINAAEGTISFNPREVSVVSVNRSNSIFSLWVTEPTFSNSAGTITFSGGSPAGYTGSAGTVMSITMRAATAGTPRLSFTQGSVLANDGKGTNVLTGMSSGSYTIGAATTAPAPEVIEYVAPANTPSAPVVRSSTHSDERAWHAAKTAVLSWELPAGITSVRTLLDDRPATIPTRVYEEPIRTLTLNDLPEGISYFHIQFRNEEGWGRVAHYRLAVDSEKPSEFSIALPPDADLSNPQQTLLLMATDTASKVIRYQVKIDNEPAYEFIDKDETGRITLPVLSPGYHAVVIEAFDQGGNGIIGSFSFTTSAFDRPVFTDYPPELGEGIIPVIKGTTRPRSSVLISLTRMGADTQEYTVTSDDGGVFTFIPEGSFSTGVYEVTALATDERGAQSETSAPIRIAVQQPGFVRIGSFLVSVLSVVVSLLALTALSVIGSWVLIGYLRRFRRRVTVESKEAIVMLRREFATLTATLTAHEEALLAARKGAKLTKAEADMIASLKTALTDAERRVEKEVADVDRVVRGGSDITLK